MRGLGVGLSLTTWWMISLQLVWVLLALRHRRRELVTPRPPLFSPTPAWLQVIAPVVRFLSFLHLPLLRPSFPPEAWISLHGTPTPPRGPGQAWDELSAAAATMPGGRAGTLFRVFLLLIITFPPPLVMALAAHGTSIGDPTAPPDAMAAFGAWIVSVGAMFSSRLHTRTSPVWVCMSFIGALFVAGAWLGSLGRGFDKPPLAE